MKDKDFYAAVLIVSAALLFLLQAGYMIYIYFSKGLMR